MEIHILFLFASVIIQEAFTGKVVLLTRQSEGCTFASDYVRNNHNVQKLAWDEELRNGAEDWAIRCALKKIMELSGVGLGENLFWTIGRTTTCDNPMFSWYDSIKNYDYDKPKWTEDDGTFIQVIYSTVSKFGIGTASYDNQIFLVGRFDQVIYTSGPFDLEHIPKPKKKVSKSDLVPSPKPTAQVVEVPIPEGEDGWTDWVKTTQCTGSVSTGIEERWCVRLKSTQACEGERKRSVACAQINPVK